MTKKKEKKMCNSYAAKKKQMKKELLKYLYSNGASTLAAITKEIPSFKGKGEITHKEDKNIILWSGMSETGNEVLNELQDDGYIDSMLGDILLYLFDECVLGYPIVERIPPEGFSEPHWLPVLFGLTEKGRNYACSLGVINEAAFSI